MKKLILYISFACFSGLTATSGLPLMAGGCSSQMNKTAEIKCAENDNECQDENAAKFNLKDSVKS